MPNRIVRQGILTSKAVNALTPLAELFYRRLLSVVDDFGRYEAEAMVLRAACYPRKLDDVKEKDIKGWLDECVAGGLVFAYKYKDTPYLEIQNFKQNPRAKTSKFPDIEGQTVVKRDANGEHLHSRCIADATQTHSTRLAPAPVVVSAYESADEDESAKQLLPGTVKNPVPSSKPKYSEEFERFWTAWGSHHRRVSKGKCYMVWKKSRLDTKIDHVLAVVNALNQGKDWNDPRDYKSAPLVWLNNEKWDCDPADIESSTSGAASIVKREEENFRRQAQEAKEQKVKNQRIKDEIASDLAYFRGLPKTRQDMFIDMATKKSAVLRGLPKEAQERQAAYLAKQQSGSNRKGN